MRVVIDTNIIISALLAPGSVPDKLLALVEESGWGLIVSEALFSEFRRVSRYPKIKARITGPRAGRLMNDLREIGIAVDPLPSVDRSRDPFDNFLLAMAEAGNADFLITGDKADLLALKTHGTCRIVTARQFLEGI